MCSWLKRRNHRPLFLNPRHQQYLRQVPISAPAITVRTTQPSQLPGTPTSKVSTSHVQSPGIPQTIFAPTPIAPPVITITVPDVLPVPQPPTVTDMGPPRHTRPPHHRATRLPVSSNTGLINPSTSEVRPLIPPYTQRRALLVRGRHFSPQGHVNHGRQTTSIPHPDWARRPS